MDKENYSAESNIQIGTIAIFEPTYGRDCSICGEFYAGNYDGSTFICPTCIKRLNRILYPEKLG